MGFDSGFLKDQVVVLNRTEAKASEFGSGSGGYTWTEDGTFWMNVTWTKGAKAMREGALDAYDTILVRCRYNDTVTRNSRLKYNGVLYSVESFHVDKMANTIQMTATEVANT